MKRKSGTTAGRWVLGVCISAAALAMARPADACSPPPPPCGGAPGTGRSIPANAPALAGWGFVNSIDSLTLTDVTSNTPLSFEWTDDAWRHGGTATFLVKPNTALVAGSTYEWNVPELCQEWGVAQSLASFLVTDPQPMPTTLGTVEVEEGAEPRPVWRWSGDGSCGKSETVPAAFARIHIRPSDDLRPFLAVANWTITIDGNTAQTRRYGEAAVTNDELSITNAGGLFQAPFGDILAECSGTSSLTPGEHEVSVAVHLAGSDTDPSPVTVRVNLTCEGLDQSVAVPQGCECASGGGVGLLGLVGLAMRRRRSGG